MPGEDGLAFIRAVRALPCLRDVPAFAFTAYASDADRARVLAAGFTGPVVKPVEPDALLNAIVDALPATG